MTEVAAIPHSATRGDLDAYLQLLAGDSPAGRLIEVRFTVPGGMRQLFVPARRTDRAATAILALAEHADVYTGVLLRTRRAGGRDAVESSHLLFVEIDRPDAHQRLVAFRHAPTASVNSGSPGHVHAYFALRHPVDLDRLVDANRRLAHALDGDLASTDASRVLRPPSSVNRKHTPPAPVTLASLDRRCRYDVDELIDGLADPPARSRASPAGATGRWARGRVEDPLLRVPAAEYVRRLTGLEPDRAGKIACPFHHPDRTPSLQLYPDRSWYCFGACQTGGSIYDFASRLWSIPAKGRAFIELRDRLAGALESSPVMRIEAIVVIVVVVLSGVSVGCLAFVERRRWRLERELDALQRADADRLAAQAAVTHASAADREWSAAHGTYDSRTYVMAGLARTLARASRQRGNALKNAHRTGLYARRTLIAEDWQPPGALHDDPDGRPIPDGWVRFDRATKTLSAVGTTSDSTLADVAAAHHELAAAAVELAERLEAAAPAGENKLARCSFCGHTIDQVKRLIAGPGVAICDECVDLCNEITTEDA